MQAATSIGRIGLESLALGGGLRLPLWPYFDPAQWPLFDPALTPQRQSRVGGSTYRTLCVRACDGYYFPISDKVTRAKFNTDSIACLQHCSGGEARLFVHRNPGQKLSNAVDLRGNRYVDLDNAFRYRKELVEGCGCEPALWAETSE